MRNSVPGGKVKGTQRTMHLGYRPNEQGTNSQTHEKEGYRKDRNRVGYAELLHNPRLSESGL